MNGGSEVDQILFGYMIFVIGIFDGVYNIIIIWL